MSLRQHNLKHVKIKKVLAEIRKELQYLFRRPLQKKTLFDHLPKCAGSSLNQYLQKQYLRRKTYSIDAQNMDGSIARFMAMSESKRHSYDLIKGHRAHELLDYAHPDCLKITVFRDPVDRIVSHYYYVKQQERHPLHDFAITADMTLAHYVKEGDSEELRNWYTSHFTGLNEGDIGCAPKKSQDEAFDIVTTKYDIIGFLDDFQSFVKELKIAAGYTDDYVDSRVNVTRVRPVLSQVAESDKDAVMQANAVDIHLYDQLKSLNKSI